MKRVGSHIERDRSVRYCLLVLLVPQADHICRVTLLSDPKTMRTCGTCTISSRKSACPAIFVRACAHLVSGRRSSSDCGQVRPLHPFDLNTGPQYMRNFYRRVQNVTATGSTSSKRVKTTLTISVKEMQFYATASAANEAAGAAGGSDDASSSQGASLSISGQVTEENDFAKMGAHHTLDLELNKDVKIVKAEWDAIAFQRVQEACNEQKGAEIGAIILGEGTLRCLSLLQFN